MEATVGTLTSKKGSLLPASLLIVPLSGIFFISGGSGLIYEVVWTRLLALVFGVTLYAVSVVLASFMAGLALGSVLAGPLADRVKHPLLWYAGLEFAIGALGVGSLAALQGITPLYVWLYGVTGDSLALASVARFLLSCGVLLLPTMAMGATLPFIVKASLSFLPHVGSSVGLLYAFNTGGAAVGTLVAGFVLIGFLGFHASVLTAASLNLIAGLLALLLAIATHSVGSSVDAATATPVAERPGAEERGSRLKYRMILLAMAVSGFCALAYEVIWFRILDLFLNGTTYAFSIMLTTFLIGLAIGSALVQPFMRLRWNWLVVLGLLELLVGLEAAYSLFALERLPALRDFLSALPFLSVLAQRPVFTMALLCSLILLPLSTLLGMTFPVAGQALSQVREDAGALIGSLNASNTTGAILGSLAGGIWLLPVLGSQESLLFLSKVNGLAAVALFLLAFRLRLWSVFVVAVSFGLLLYPSTATARMVPGILQNIFRDHQLLWYEEGLENTVSVQKGPEGYTFLYLNSRTQASDSPGMVAYHRLIGQLPLLLHQDPKEVLVIGFGGGATSDAVSALAESQVDIVELSPSVVRAADHLKTINNDVLRRSKVRLLVDDGRNHLLLTKKKYDIITADIIQPIHAGSGNLYSQEYFQLAKGGLKEGGLMVQWANPGLPNMYPLIVRTFQSVFPYVTTWYNGSLLVGSTHQQDLDPVKLQQHFDKVPIQEVTRSMGVAGAADLLRYYTGTAEEFLRNVSPGPVLTDDRPLTEYFRSVPGTAPISPLATPESAAR